MHLEELFELIEQNRREFMAKRAAKVFSRAEDEGEKSANGELEPVLMEVGTGELPDGKD